MRLAAESAREILRSYGDAPVSVSETAEGHVILGSQHAVLLSDDGQVEVEQIDEAYPGQNRSRAPKFREASIREQRRDEVCAACEHLDDDAKSDVCRKYRFIVPDPHGQVCDAFDRMHEAVDEARLPKIDSPVYTKTEKLPKYNRLASPLSVVSPIDGARLLVRRLPDWSKSDHASAAKKHEQAAAKMEKEWNKVVDQAAQETWGRSYQATDYRVSGIVSSEFSNKHKDRLRYLAQTATKHKDAAAAHAAVKTLRSLPNESVDEGPLGKVIDFLKGAEVYVAKRDVNLKEIRPPADRGGDKTRTQELRVRRGDKIKVQTVSGGKHAYAKHLGTGFEFELPGKVLQKNFYAESEDDLMTTTTRDDEIAEIVLGEGAVELQIEGDTVASVACDVDDPRSVREATIELENIAEDDLELVLVDDEDDELDEDEWAAAEGAWMDDLRHLLADHITAETAEKVFSDVQAFDELVKEGEYEMAATKAEQIAAVLGIDERTIRRLSRGQIAARARNRKVQTPEERKKNRLRRRQRKTSGSARNREARYRRRYKPRAGRESVEGGGFLMSEKYANDAHRASASGKMGTNDALYSATAKYFHANPGHHTFGAMKGAMGSQYTGSKGASDSDFMRIMGRLMKEGVLEYTPGKGYAMTDDARESLDAIEAGEDPLSEHLGWRRGRLGR